MNTACVDLEGVLIPELWPLVADATGIGELAITTREWPDYPSLVTRRIELLNHHGLRLVELCSLLGRVEPLVGARRFVEQLAMSHRIIIVSDGFREMLEPLWLKLGSPELRCHHFICDHDGRIERAHYTRQRGKHEELEGLKALGYGTLAVGDAFNDLSMLRSADQGFLFRPSPETLNAAGDLHVVYEYEDILGRLGKTPS